MNLSMLQFLIKGILRDRTRSLLPISVITIGVFAIIFLIGMMYGFRENLIESTAKSKTGHVQITTVHAYENPEQKNLEDAILGVNVLINQLKNDYPQMNWTERIQFGGLIDFQDQAGNSKAQGPVIVTSYDLIGVTATKEKERLNFKKSITQGREIQNKHEIIIGEEFSKKYGVELGDEVIIMTTSFGGSFGLWPLKVVGMIYFGIPAMDKGAVILDISDAKEMLDLEDASMQILGFFADKYNDQEAKELIANFNGKHTNKEDIYSPIMASVMQLDNLQEVADFGDSVINIMLIILGFALFIVLWNAGLLGSVRRYDEFSIRLAQGEEKSYLYKTLLIESFIIGIIGSFIGTVIGLIVCYYISIYGIDTSSELENLSWVMDPIMRTKIVPEMFYFGFILGTVSMVLGSAIAGRAIFKRDIARLFQELD